MENETTCISKFEYDKMIEGLKQYKQIKELKPIADVLERNINKLIVWI